MESKYKVGDKVWSSANDQTPFVVFKVHECFNSGCSWRDRGCGGYRYQDVYFTGWGRCEYFLSLVVVKRLVQGVVGARRFL